MCAPLLQRVPFRVWKLSGLQQLLQPAQVLSDGLRGFTAEDLGYQSAGAAAGRRVLKVHRDLCTPAVANRIEIDRSGADHIGVAKRSPRDQFVRDVIDDFRFPLDPSTGRALCDPLRSAVATVADIVEIVHELREVLE